MRGVRRRVRGGVAANVIEIIGVHLVPSDQPVHIIEIELTGDVSSFDFSAVTQEQADQPQANWQVAYDERLVSQEGEQVRFAFFFHYLDLAKPLLTSVGPIELPKESPLPPYLSQVGYESP